MSGAIIPDDWDNVSFNCQKVVWPSSEKWRAILLGQITEPERHSFWDDDSGSVDDVTLAVKEAEMLTSPGYWTEDCDAVSGHPVVAFKVELNTPQVLTIDTWNTILWADYFYQYNIPGFDFATSGHKPVSAGHLGLWHYDVLLNIQPAGSFRAARAVVLGTGEVLARADEEWPFLHVSFDYVWTITGQTILIQVYPIAASTVQTLNGHTHYSGHYVGEMS